ncbi:hypothetical protein BJF79_41365 [Actinomadura sp. CNU-125]|uniref:hypothetical protein n=1 Tax=Actinomadura sp. CNU-125 TaxID=1904961 RepID=UPI00095FB08D|nr:hypothetical protein [Actinomadura sp. CNU-125]OLT28739.1 hypothetical protein BJF79_41365 [Actinomadura sp. CNU-125]
MTETPTTQPAQTAETTETTAAGAAATGAGPSGTAGGGAGETRADRFVRQLAEMKIPDPSAGRARLWLQIGVALMVAGLAAGVAAYFLSRGTTDSLAQRDAQAVGTAGICACIVGSALYLRYTLANVLRFWFARLTLSVEAGPAEAGPDGPGAVEQTREDND